jgi:hypothetical protein
MEALEKLNQQEKERLFKAPSYVSLLAANADGEMDEEERMSAIEFSHIKTYSCDPLLTNFYKEVEKVFVANLRQLDNQLPKGKTERNEVINKELLELEPLFTKLGYTYAKKLHRSFTTYTEHVSKAHRNSLTSFIFPF